MIVDLDKDEQAGVAEIHQTAAGRSHQTGSNGLFGSDEVCPSTASCRPLRSSSCDSKMKLRMQLKRSEFRSKPFNSGTRQSDPHEFGRTIVERDF